MSNLSPVQRVLAQAAEDADTTEQPRGSNRGPRVEQMLRYTGLGGGYPWCAAAVAAWGVEALGEAWPVPRTADCDAILSWARRKGVLRKTDAQPGDIFLVMRTSSDAIHTGLVIRELANGTVQTWEGNTNNGGSREGWRVCNRIRSTRNLWYVRWTEELEEDGSEPRPLETPAYRVWVSPHGWFPRVQMRSGRPCAPVRELTAAILSISLEATADIVQWISESQLASVRGKELPGTYLIADSFDGAGRSTAWAPVREIAEALGCVVSVADGSVTIGTPSTNSKTS